MLRGQSCERHGHRLNDTLCFVIIAQGSAEYAASDASRVLGRNQTLGGFRTGLDAFIGHLGVNARHPIGLLQGFVDLLHVTSSCAKQASSIALETTAPSMMDPLTENPASAATGGILPTRHLVNHSLCSPSSAPACLSQSRIVAAQGSYSCTRLQTLCPARICATNCSPNVDFR